MTAKLTSVVLDSPDPQALARFYSELLDLPVTRVDGDWVDIGDGTTKLSFQHAPEFRPPLWPDPNFPQQIHLDIQVDDIDATESKVLRLGASAAVDEGGRLPGIQRPVRAPVLPLLRLRPYGSVVAWSGPRAAAATVRRRRPVTSPCPLSTRPGRTTARSRRAGSTSRRSSGTPATGRSGCGRRWRHRSADLRDRLARLDGGARLDARVDRGEVRHVVAHAVPTEDRHRQAAPASPPRWPSPSRCRSASPRGPCRPRRHRRQSARGDDVAGRIVVVGLAVGRLALHRERVLDRLPAGPPRPRWPLPRSQPTRCHRREAAARRAFGDLPPWRRGRGGRGAGGARVAATAGGAERHQHGDTGKPGAQRKHRPPPYALPTTPCTTPPPSAAPTAIMFGMSLLRDHGTSVGPCSLLRIDVAVGRCAAGRRNGDLPPSAHGRRSAVVAHATIRLLRSSDQDRESLMRPGSRRDSGDLSDVSDAGDGVAPPHDALGGGCRSGEWRVVAGRTRSGVRRTLP